MLVKLACAERERRWCIRCVQRPFRRRRCWWWREGWHERRVASGVTWPPPPPHNGHRALYARILYYTSCSSCVHDTRRVFVQGRGVHRRWRLPSIIKQMYNIITHTYRLYVDEARFAQDLFERRFRSTAHNIYLYICIYNNIQCMYLLYYYSTHAII